MLVTVRQSLLKCRIRRCTIHINTYKLQMNMIHIKFYVIIRYLLVTEI